VGLLFIVALASAALLAVCWDQTVEIGGDASSVPVLIASFGAGLVGSTSMVTFFPLASEYGTTAITFLSAGVGACGLITQLISFGQGVSNGDASLRFSVSVFYWSMTGVLIFCGMGFLGILYDDKLEKVSWATVPREDDPVDLEEDATERCARDTDNLIHLFWQYRRIFLNTVFTCVLQFSTTGLLSYLCDQRADAGTKQSQIFWLTFVYFLGSLIGRFGPGIYQVMSMEISNLIQFGLWVYCIVISNRGHLQKEDPNYTLPPVFLSTIVMFGFSVCHGYTVTIVFVAASRESHLVSQWAGVFNQIGALLGALLAFILVHMGVMQ